MYEEENYDPGLNTIVHKVGDALHQDEMKATEPEVAERSGSSDTRSQKTAEQRDAAIPTNDGNFGTADQIISDNAATRRAGADLDDEEMAEGPSNTAPDTAQGSM